MMLIIRLLFSLYCVLLKSFKTNILFIQKNYQWYFWIVFYYCVSLMTATGDSVCFSSTETTEIKWQHPIFFIWDSSFQLNRLTMQNHNAVIVQLIIIKSTTRNFYLVMKQSQIITDESFTTYLEKQDQQQEECLCLYI